MTLSPQQYRIVEMVARDMSAKAIAQELGCSQHTVRAHIRAVRERTGYRSTLSLAVAYARGEFAQPRPWTLRRVA